MRYQILILFLLPAAVFGQKAVYPPPGLEVIGSIDEYRAGVSADSNKRLVEISKYVPGVKLDIRYATRNNFTGQAVYPQARAFARLPVVKALAAVQNDLKRKGLGLKIYDAYRPYAITVKFWDIASDKNFVANPAEGSKHNRGCAIDLTLIDLQTGKEIEMPTPYDSFSPAAAADYEHLPSHVKGNRQTLKDAMEKHGFRMLHNEWWHFDFTGWRGYPLMDISFRELGRSD